MLIAFDADLSLLNVAQDSALDMAEWRVGRDEDDEDDDEEEEDEEDEDESEEDKAARLEEEKEARHEEHRGLVALLKIHGAE